MPATIQGKQVDEEKWAEAKRRAVEEGHEKDWAYVMSIYKKMAGMKSRLVIYVDHLMKAATAAQGEVHQWADGTLRKKVGKKWVVVGGPKQKTTKKVEEESKQKAEQYFNYSMTTNLGEHVEKVLQDMEISTYEDLVEKIKTGPSDTAHKIYKKIVDHINVQPGTVGEKQAVLDYFGRSLIALRNQYATQPKTKLKIKVTSKKGKTYYKYDKKEELPTLKASAVSSAKKKVAGWSITGPLETKHVKGMIEKGTAKLVSGKINAKKKWIMPKKAEDMILKYKGDHLLIRVKQIKKVQDRTRATAKVEIKLPYAYAKAFLQNHIEGKNTRSNFIFRMENSQGYRDFLRRAAA